jgi:hypothetical protein
MVTKHSLILFSLFASFAIYEFIHETILICGSQVITGKMWFMWIIMAIMALRR